MLVMRYDQVVSPNPLRLIYLLQRGQTALHLASLNGFIKGVETLLAEPTINVAAQDEVSH